MKEKINVKNIKKLDYLKNTLRCDLVLLASIFQFHC